MDAIVRAGTPPACMPDTKSGGVGGLSPSETVDRDSLVSSVTAGKTSIDSALLTNLFGLSVGVASRFPTASRRIWFGTADEQKRNM